MTGKSFAKIRMRKNEDVVDKFISGGMMGGTKHLFIEGPTLYSYGHHFPLAKRVPEGLLLNTDRYSMTTSHHRGLVNRMASAAHIPVHPTTTKRLEEGQESI